MTGAAGAAVMAVEPGDELVGMAVLPAGKGQGGAAGRQAGTANRSV